MNQQKFIEAVFEFPEAYSVKGTLSNGGPYASRLRIGAPETASMSADEVKQYQSDSVKRMNDLGANVRLFHERINPDTLTWEADNEA